MGIMAVKYLASKHFSLRQLLVKECFILACILQPGTDCVKGAASPNGPADGLELNYPPSFAVQYLNGNRKLFRSHDLTSAERWNYSDENLDAFIERVKDDQLKLVITTKDSTVKEVYFPWFEHKILLNSNLKDDFVYYPYRLGLLMKPELRVEWGWWGVDYPGGSFAPVIIIADDTDAIMVAANNWPPKKVRPIYSLRRISMLYSEKIGPHSSSTYMAMIIKVKGDAAKGYYPWQLALDNYKVWLKDKMTQEGLYPILYPQWMRKVDGFINIQLENITKFDISDIYEKWNKWGSVFPWFQFWGQMSEGYPNPEYGCCLENKQVHPRYMPELVTFAKNITGTEGLQGHVGYYSRPAHDTILVAPGLSNADTGLGALLDWLRVNKELYYANVFYLDTVGGKYMGDPLRVAKLFKGVFPEDTFIEFSVDVYPTAFLASGSLGGRNWRDKKWGKDKSDLSGNFQIIPFPGFGRYLLNDRIIFLGESNGDHVLWGQKADYWAERNAFLLGAKFDVITPQDGKGESNSLNSALYLAIAERKRVNWWDRNPVYYDVNGIYNVPESICVRRFVDASGKNLLVVDNWRQVAGLKINFQDKIIEIPARKLCIMDLN
jgi:hypothetical protein